MSTSEDEQQYYSVKKSQKFESLNYTFNIIKYFTSVLLTITVLYESLLFEGLRLKFD